MLGEESIIILRASMSETPDETRIDRVRVESTSVAILTTFPMIGSLSNNESIKSFPVLVLKYLYKNAKRKVMPTNSIGQNLLKKVDTSNSILVEKGSSMSNSL